MATFNRTRKRDLGTTTGHFLMEQNQSSYSEVWAPYWSYDLTLQNREQILDWTPVGRYKPGQFKITEVQRQRILTKASPISGVLKYDAGSVPGMKLSGDYIHPLVFYYSGYSDYFLGPYLASKQEIDNLGMLALSKAKAPDVGVGETLAEAGASLRMLLSPMSGLAALLRKILYVNPKSLSLRPLKDASSAWLEARYGWIPLYETAKAVVDGLPVYKLNYLFDSHAEGKSKTSTIIGPYWIRPVWGNVTTILVDGIEEVEVKRRFQAYFRVLDPDLFAATRTGTGVFSVPGLLWELAPLSFVLDWWLNVGDWIYALMPNPSIQLLGCTFSTRKKVSQFSFARSIMHANSGYTTDCTGSFQCIQDAYLREIVLPPSTVPKLDLNLNSIKHVIDALSLIIQRVPAKGYKT